MGRHKTVSDDEILVAARAAFDAQGHAASTRDIADSAGLSQAALFQRFGDKSRLFVAAMSPEPVDVSYIVGDVEEALSLGAEGHIAAMTIRLHKQVEIAVPRILQLTRNPLLDPETVQAAHARLGVRVLIGALLSRLKELQERRVLQKPVEPQALLEAILMAVHGLVFMHLASPQPPTSAETTLRRFVGTLLS